MSNHEFINASKEGILENKCIKESLIQLQINLNMTAFIFTTQNGHRNCSRIIITEKHKCNIKNIFFCSFEHLSKNIDLA